MRSADLRRLATAPLPTQPCGMRYVAQRRLGSLIFFARARRPLRTRGRGGGRALAAGKLCTVGQGADARGNAPQANSYRAVAIGNAFKYLGRPFLAPGALPPARMT